MQIRVISDLHIDVNKKQSLEYNDDIFTIISGDISGDVFTTEEWLKSNIKKGLFILGNHESVNYNLAFKDTYTIQDSIKYMQNKFPIDANLSFLENTYKIVNDIVFIGCTLYTDYLYNNSEINNIAYALTGLNDFTFGRYNKKGCVERLVPNHYLEMFKVSLKYIDNTLNKFKDKKCVLITHHGMSPKCIDKKYKKSIFNASFVSDLEKFIKKHKNLKMIISGHSHVGYKTFKVGSCKYIMNARGYTYKNEDTTFVSDLIIEI